MNTSHTSGSNVILDHLYNRSYRLIDYLDQLRSQISKNDPKGNKEDGEPHKKKRKLKWSEGGTLLNPVTSFKVSDSAHSEYENLLLNGRVCPNEAFESNQDNIDAFCLQSTQNEIVNQVISRLLRKSDYQNHVLALGYQRHSSRHNEVHGFSDTHGLECHFPNTIVNYVKRVPWVILHEQIGDYLMLYLLQSTSLFIPLQNKCFLQVCGPPVVEQVFKNGPFLPRPNTAPKPVSKEALKPTGSSMAPKKYKTMQNRRISRDSALFADVRLKKCGLGPSHPLNVLNVSSTGTVSRRSGERLTKLIFMGVSLTETASDMSKNEKKIHRLPNRYQSLVPFLQRVIRANSTTDYHSILSHFCPLPSFLTSTRKEQDVMFVEDSDSEIDANPPSNQIGDWELKRHIFDETIQSQASSEEEEINLVSDSMNTSTQVAESLPTSNPNPPVEIEVAESEYGNSDDDLNINDKSYRSLVEACLDHDQVIGFIRAACHRVIPHGLIGSRSNWDIIHTGISKLTNLRRFEQISLDDVMRGFKVTDCGWAKANLESIKSCSPQFMLSLCRVAEDLIFWLFSDYIVPLIRCHFYVTESATFRNKLLYYRRPVWSRVIKLAESSMESSIYQRINPSSLTLPVTARRLPSAPLRFLPKRAGVRPITNMKKLPSRREVQFLREKLGREESIQPVNIALREAFSVITYEKKKENLGASVFSYDDVYEKLVQFKKIVGPKLSEKKLYCVKCDVKSAYDRIVQDKLYEYVKEIITHDEYLIRRFVSICPNAGAVKVRYHQEAQDPVSFQQFAEFAQDVSKKMINVIYTDRVFTPMIERQKCLDLLREHIYCNIVRIGPRYYKQTRGIPQGSIVSSLLCSFFFGAMENAVIFSIFGSGKSLTEDTLLMRFTDDFLCLTLDLEIAKSFSAVMHRGISEWGCAVNPKKSLVNFSHEVVFNAANSGPHLESLSTLHTGTGSTNNTDTITTKIPQCQSTMTWCGLRINLDTLQITSDYSRLVGSRMGDGLTIKSIRHAGLSLRKKILSYISTRIHILYLDEQLNSNTTVITSIYEAYIVTAIKFCSHVREIPYRNREFLIGVINDCVSYATVVVHKRFDSPLARRCDAVSRITSSMVEYIGYCAFLKVLLRNKLNFSREISYIQSRLKRSRYSDMNAVDIGMAAESTKIFDRVRF